MRRIVLLRRAYYSDTVPENKIEVSEDNESEEDDSDDEDDLESGSDIDSDEEEEEEDNDSDSDDEDAQPIVLGDNSEVASLEIEEVEIETQEENKINQELLN